MSLLWPFKKSASGVNPLAHKIAPQHFDKNQKLKYRVSTCAVAVKQALILPTMMLAGACILSLGTTSQALAQGYYIDEQSAKRLGDAFSGGAADASDASTVFYNPAGMVRLDSMQLVGNLSGVYTQTDVTMSGYSFDASSATMASAIQGQEQVNLDESFLIPSVYLSYQLSPSWHVGVSLNVPYSSGSEFDTDFVGRYFSLKSDITSVNLGLMASYRISSAWSVGVGLNTQYIEAEIQNQVNSAGICQLGVASGMSADACTGLDSSGTYTDDGNVKMTGDDLAFGYTIGVLYQLDFDTRFGLNYRSKISHTLTGDATISAPAIVGMIEPLLTSRVEGGSVELVTPETLDLSGVYQLNTDWHVQATVSWFRWSRFETLDIELDNGGGFSTAQNWDDSYRFAAGLGYQLTPHWVLRTGIAYETTPVPDETVSLDFAFGDFYALSVGASYQFSDTLYFDVGYQHTFSFNRDISQGSLTADSAEVSGNMETSINSLALGVNWLF
ncbi:OmpP1/FadL family transporter [Shewanella surugensis]|uniref:Outer membrane protein transport protein n=1 Tax=Shewanella surugensis TaxID=212020 RepID=A0ABT0LIT8_9GAMM|nr:outer membrane protein transport protein [Shewanella surugensis]MCL1127212.1 outer membrane protein transport protein [Shewanella surugensis]